MQTFLSISSNSLLIYNLLIRSFVKVLQCKSEKFVHVNEILLMIIEFFNTNPETNSFNFIKNSPKNVKILL